MECRRGGVIGTARGRTYRVRAIVLDKTKLKETDLILTLLADSGRQIRAVAKGARKPGGRLAARCELGCEIDVLLACGRALDVVSQAELIAAPLGAAPSFELLSAGSAVVEVAERCSFEDADDPFAFAITAAVLQELGAADAAHLDVLVAAYVFKLLSRLGYRPDLAACVACADEDVTHFSALAGGLVCASCAATVPGAERIEPALVAWLRALMGLRLAELAAAPVEAQVAARLLALAHVWAATHLDARLRALEFMLGR